MSMLKELYKAFLTSSIIELAAEMMKDFPATFLPSEPPEEIRGTVLEECYREARRMSKTAGEAVKRYRDCVLRFLG